MQVGHINHSPIPRIYFYIEEKDIVLYACYVFLFDTTRSQTTQRNWPGVVVLVKRNRITWCCA